MTERPILAKDLTEAVVVQLALGAPLEISSDAIGAVISQLPEVTSLPRGTRVVILGEPLRAGGIFARLFHRDVVPRAVRCSALLARGYVHIGAGHDARKRDLAWGYAD